MKKIIILLVILSGVAGGVFWYRDRQVKAPASVVRPVVQKPVPIRDSPLEAPPQIVTNGYVIGVVSVSKSINGEIIGLKVTNDGDTTLPLTPDTKFKLVGLKDQTTRLPIPENTSEGFAKTLEPDDSSAGSVVFDIIPEQQSELRFYPDPSQQAYIVVPLIPLPADQI